MPAPPTATIATSLRGPRVRRTTLLAAVAGLVALAIWGVLQAVEPGALQAAFAAVSWPWVVLAAAAYAASQVASALVWGVGLSAGGLGAVERRHVLSAHWIGRGACELLPAQLGETARYAAIRRHPVAAARSGWRIAGSVGAHKLVDGAVTFVVVAVFTLAMPMPPQAAGLRWLALAAIVGLCLTAVILWRVDSVRLLRLLPRRLRRPLLNLSQGAALLARKRESLRAIAFQLTAVAGRVLSIAALLHAFGLPTHAALLVFSLVVISGMVPISPGGVGVREAAIVPAMVAAYGLGTAPALAFSLGVQATALTVSVLGAAAALLIQRRWPPAARAGVAA